jgi:nitroreductase
MAQAELEPLVHEPLPAGERRSRVEAFRALLARRRSVRDFSHEPVERQVIEAAVRAAASAPSGANQQPWTFVCVSDPAVRRRIRLAAEEEEKAFYAGRAGEAWLGALAPLGTTWEKPFLETAPWLIAVFAHRHGVAADGSRVKHYYVQESVGIACGFLLAALHVAGLATLTHTPAPMDFLNGICGRPEHERPVVLVVVGHPAEGCRVPRIARKPLSEVAVFL